MPWLIQLDRINLDVVAQIDYLTEAEIKRLVLVLDGDHFDRNVIKGLLAKGRIPRTRGAKESAMAPVCDRLEKVLDTGRFEFDLFREISGWFNTGISKPGGDLLEEIIKKLFYGQAFGRFTEHDNQRLIPNFRAVFLPWLHQVFIHR